MAQPRVPVRFLLPPARLYALIAIAFAAWSALAADRSVAAGLDRGAQLAAMCASCHRMDGHDEGIPTIIGLEPQSLIATFAAFKSGARQSQIMHAVAISLTDDEVTAVAAYLAAQKKE